MARYAKLKNGDDWFVWDQEKDILYIGDDADVFWPAKFGIVQLGKFCPYADLVGEFDEFPGEIGRSSEDKMERME